MPGELPDPRVVALARDVERTARRVGELDTMLRQLAADVAAFPGVGDDPEGGDPGGRVRAWLLADDADQARADLADLCEWLAAVYLRYPDAALPSCWAFHGHVVEELRWLREAHRDAYSDGGCWKDVGDWHDRQRPGVAKRIRGAVGGCELALHAPGAEHADRPYAAPLARYADLIAGQWATEHTAPEPTADQLAESERHDRDEHRNGAQR